MRQKKTSSGPVSGSGRTPLSFSNLVRTGEEDVVALLRFSSRRLHLYVARSLLSSSFSPSVFPARTRPSPSTLLSCATLPQLTRSHLVHRRNPRPLPLVVLAMAIATLAACATTPEFDAPLGSSSLGSVFLERIPDRSFHAAHPTMLETSILRTALESILIEDAHVSISSLLSDTPRPLRAFTNAEVAFLAPLFSDGLRQAASDQQIGFTLIHQDGLFSHRDAAGAGVGSSVVTSSPSTRETSSGSVFVHGRSLHIQFHQLRVKPERPDAVNMPNRRLPDRTGLTDHALSFAFPSARRPASYVIQGDAAVTLVLDYEQLAGISSIPSPIVTPAPSQTRPGANPIAPSTDREADVRTLQEQMQQKDRELESVRKELQEIRQHLNRQPPEPAAPATDRVR